MQYKRVPLKNSLSAISAHHIKLTSPGYNSLAGSNKLHNSQNESMRREGENIKYTTQYFIEMQPGNVQLLLICSGTAVMGQFLHRKFSKFSSNP